MRALLLDDTLDPAFKAQALTLPSESSLADRMEVVTVEPVHEVREAVRAGLARRLADAFASMHEANRPRRTVSRLGTSDAARSRTSASAT